MINEKTEINSFIEHGFNTPTWKGKIDKCNSNNYFGIIEEENTELNAIFLKCGRAFIITEDDIESMPCYDLTPINKEDEKYLDWYNKCNFPLLVTNKNTKEIIQALDIFGDTLMSNSGPEFLQDYRPSTIEEIEEFLYIPKGE